MSHWQCVKNCGACCHLDPKERPDLEDYLTPQELEHYLSLVGEGGWCIHFERTSRLCSIYEQRPRFCRVKPDIFAQMYRIQAAEFDDFAIDCCRQQIGGVYGEESQEMEQYNYSIALKG